MKSQANENATIDSETEGNVKETTKAAPTEDILVLKVLTLQRNLGSQRIHVLWLHSLYTCHTTERPHLRHLGVQ